MSTFRYKGHSTIYLEPVIIGCCFVLISLAHVILTTLGDIITSSVLHKTVEIQ